MLDMYGINSICTTASVWACKQSVCVFFLQVEESWVLPAQSLSENEQLIEDDLQKEEQTAQEVDKKQYSEVQYS